MAARVEALASQINPHFLFNTLTSISSLIRSQPETARTLIVKLSGLLRRLLRSQEHFVTLREELEAIDEYLDIESIRFGPQLRIEKAHRPDTPRHRRPEHAAAAAGRELDQARAVAEDRRRPDHHPQHARRTATRSSTSSTTASASPPIDADRVKPARHRPAQRQRAAARDLRRQLPAAARQRARRRHVRAHRDSGAGRAGQDHRLTMDTPSRCARSSSTTSSWRAKSCASCSGSSDGIEVVGAGRQRHRGAARDRGARAGPGDARRPDAGADRVRGRAAAAPGRRRRADRVRHRLRPVRDRGVRSERGRLPAEAGRAERLATAVDRVRKRRIQADRPAAEAGVSRASWSGCCSCCPSVRAGASSWRSRSATGSCWSRRTRWSMPRWRTT